MAAHCMKNLAKIVAVVLLLIDAIIVMAAKPQELILEREVLELPGQPVDLVPADLNGDTRVDLLVVVSYTDWGEITESDRLDDLAIIEVVPVMFDRRELWSFLAVEQGGYVQAADPLPLPTSVAAIISGRGLPAYALTDEGLSMVRLETEGLRIEQPFHQEPSVLAGGGSYFPGLNLARDVNGDGLIDLLFPGRETLGVLFGSTGDSPPRIIRLQRLPGDHRTAGSTGRRSYPLPMTKDVDGDGTTDLVVRGLATPFDDERSWWFLRGLGEGTFADALQLTVQSCRDGSDSTNTEEETPASEIVFVGNLDGEGPAEIVTRTVTDSDKQRSKLNIHRINSKGEVQCDPARSINIEGEPIGGAWPDFDKGGFEDLDGDGRIDLVTVAFDVSVFQMARAMMTKKITVKLDFRVWVQNQELRFSEVQESTFKQKLKLELNDLRLNRLGHFGGDFDGDGKVDFVRLSNNKRISIHRGREGAQYPSKPDLEIGLDTAPEDLGLVRIIDLNGDDLSDVVIVHKIAATHQDESQRSKVELLLSRGAS